MIKLAGIALRGRYALITMNSIHLLPGKYLTLWGLSGLVGLAVGIYSVLPIAWPIGNRLGLALVAAVVVFGLEGLAWIRHSKRIGITYRRDLNNLIDRIDDLKSLASVTHNELSGEQTFSPYSLGKLKSVVQQLEKNVDSLISVPAIWAMKFYARGVYCLLEAIQEHTRQEVVFPFNQTAATGAERQQLVREAEWGNCCVLYLVNHLIKEIKDQPLFDPF